jgi:hypothetical protein
VTAEWGNLVVVLGWRENSMNEVPETAVPPVEQKPLRPKRKYRPVKSKMPERRGGDVEAKRRERKAVWEEMVKLRIRGATLKDCADILGYRQQTVETWNKLPEFQAMLAATRAAIFGNRKPANSIERVQARARENLERVEELIDRYSVDAIRVINVKMRRSPDERIQLRAAMDLANRGSRTAKTKRVQQQNIHAILTPELLVQMAKTAREIQEFGHAIKPVELDEHVVSPREIDDGDIDLDESF